MPDEFDKSLADAFHILSVYYKEEVYEQALEYALRIKTKYEPHLDPSHQMLFELYMKISILYGYNGMHAQQLETCLKSLEIFQDQIKDNPAKEIALYTNLITAYKDLHYYSEALAYGDRTMALYQANPELFTQEHELDMCGTMADLYRWNGQNEKAIEWYLKTNEIYTKIFGRKHEGIAHNFRLIARIYSKNGQHPKALEWLLKSLSVLEKLPNRDCPGLVFTQSALAQQYEIMGQSAKASEYLSKMKTAFDTEGKLTRVSRIVLAANICHVYRYKGEHKQALEWQQKAVSMAEKYYGKEHPNTAIEYNNLGEVYTEMENNNMALKNHIKAFNIFEKLFGLENDGTLNLLIKLGQANFRARNFEKAEEQMLLSIEYAQKIYGEEETYKLFALYIDLARNYTFFDKSEQAEQYFLKAFSLQEKFEDKINTKYIIDSLHLVSHFYLLKHDYTTALKYATIRLEMIRKTHNKESAKTLFAICEVAKCYVGMNEFDKAIELFLQVLRSFVSRHGLHHEYCQTVYAELGLTYKLAGLEEDFALWFMRNIKDLPLHKPNRKKK